MSNLDPRKSDASRSLLDMPGPDSRKPIQKARRNAVRIIRDSARGTIRNLSRIGARVVIDLFFMTGFKDFLDVGIDCDLSSDDPFVAAGNLLQAVTGFTPGRVQAELNWYSQERGYPLSYLLGNKLVTGIKAELVDAQEGRLEGLALDREFHRIFLGAGNMPAAWLRKLLVHEGLLSS